MLSGSMRDLDFNPNHSVVILKLSKLSCIYKLNKLVMNKKSSCLTPVPVTDVLQLCTAKKNVLKNHLEALCTTFKSHQISYILLFLYDYCEGQLYIM